jgi:hypothetical protein
MLYSLLRRWPFKNWFMKRKNPAPGSPEQLRRNLQATGVDFISTEIDLAITFCDSALATTSSERADRNIVNAKNAYYSAVHFMKTFNVAQSPEHERRSIDEKPGALKSRLEQLGENV